MRAELTTVVLAPGCRDESDMLLSASRVQYIFSSKPQFDG